MDKNEVDEEKPPFLEIESKGTKLSRIGQLEPVRGLTTIKIDLENNLHKDMLVKSAHKLKKYKGISTPIVISHELSPRYIKTKNEALKLRRDRMKKGVSKEILRIRNLKRQKLVEVWTTVSTVEESN